MKRPALVAADGHDVSRLVEVARLDVAVHHVHYRAVRVLDAKGQRLAIVFGRCGRPGNPLLGPMFLNSPSSRIECRIFSSNGGRIPHGAILHYPLHSGGFADPVRNG